MCTVKWFSYIYTHICVYIYIHIYMPYSRSSLVINFIYSSVYMLFPKFLIYLSSPPFPFGNHKFVFEVCETVSVFEILWFSKSINSIRINSSHVFKTCFATWRANYWKVGAQLLNLRDCKKKKKKDCQNTKSLQKARTVIWVYVSE